MDKEKENDIRNKRNWKHVQMKGSWHELKTFVLKLKCCCRNYTFHHPTFKGKFNLLQSFSDKLHNSVNCAMLKWLFSNHWLAWIIQVLVIDIWHREGTGLGTGSSLCTVCWGGISHQWSIHTVCRGGISHQWPILRHVQQG